MDNQIEQTIDTTTESVVITSTETVDKSDYLQRLQDAVDANDDIIANYTSEIARIKDINTDLLSKIDSINITKK